MSPNKITGKNAGSPRPSRVLGTSLSAKRTFCRGGLAAAILLIVALFLAQALAPRCCTVTRLAITPCTNAVLEASFQARARAPMRHVRVKRAGTGQAGKERGVRVSGKHSAICASYWATARVTRWSWQAMSCTRRAKVSSSAVSSVRARPGRGVRAGGPPGFDCASRGGDRRRGARPAGPFERPGGWAIGAERRWPGDARAPRRRSRGLVESTA